MLRSIVFAVIIGMLAGAGCNDKGSEPCPVAHNVYIAARFYDDEGITRDPLYYLDSDSLNVIDSIPNLGAIYDLEVSPDGRWLYASINRDTPLDTLKKIDAETKQVIWAIPSHKNPRLSLHDNGNLVLRGALDVVNANDPTDIRAFGDSLLRQEGPVGGTRVAAIVNDHSNRMRIVDLVSGSVQGHYVPKLSSGQVLPSVFYAKLHSDFRRVFVIGALGPHNSRFLIGDMDTGETLLEHHLNSPYGEVAVSSDGRFAVVTDPGVTGLMEGPYPAQLFDLVETKHVKQLLITGGQSRFLPGDQRVIDAPYPDYWSVTPPRVFNLSTFSIEKLVWMPDSVSWLGALGIGPRPCP